MIIFRDGTKDTKRGKFQVRGCLSVITLSQDAWVHTFWQFKIGFVMRWLKRGGGSKQTQPQDIGNRESPCPVWKAATDVSQIACFGALCMFRVLLAAFFHRFNCEWGQLPGHAANVRHPCNFWHPRPSVPTGWSPSTLVQAYQGLSWRHSKGCLDWTWRPYCLARQVSRSHTFGLFLLGQRQGLQYCCQWDRPP